MKTSIMGSLVALFSGFIFGIGLLYSGMNNPAKVRAFLDIFGAWEPALIGVMGSAVLVFMLAYAVSGKFKKPLFALNFHKPSLIQIDKRLIIGAIMFGIGWGIIGLCPGPALVNILSLNTEIILFVLALVGGNRLAHYLIGPAK